MKSPIYHKSARKSPNGARSYHGDPIRKKGLFGGGDRPPYPTSSISRISSFAIFGDWVGRAFHHIRHLPSRRPPLILHMAPTGTSSYLAHRCLFSSVPTKPVYVDHLTYIISYPPIVNIAAHLPAHELTPHQISIRGVGNIYRPIPHR